MRTATALLFLAIGVAVHQRHPSKLHPWPADIVRDHAEGSLRGLSVLITGANAGIGFQTALAFAQHGARVLLACRNVTRCAEAAQKIGHGAESVAESLDLAEPAAVRSFAAAALQQLKAKPSDRPSLDILVLNAGRTAIGQGEVVFTEAGLEARFAANHVGHFVLARLLRPALRRARRSPARIVVVASRSHKLSPPLPQPDRLADMAPGQVPDLGTFSTWGLKRDLELCVALRGHGDVALGRGHAVAPELP